MLAEGVGASQRTVSQGKEWNRVKEAAAWGMQWVDKLAGAGYLAEPELATTVGLAAVMERPLLLEGPAGSGKTQLAYALAAIHRRELVRLQCYEGIDAQNALYDWNYHGQLAALTRTPDINPFSLEFLLPRPLYRALTAEGGAVLLVDEVDRADEAFEALLLEYLSEYRMSIPELGTVTATVPPVVVLTSNRTRPLSDALRRRCLYFFLDWPQRERELAIVALHVPRLPTELAERVVDAVRCLRSWDLVKPPGVAETLDWARALMAMEAAEWSAGLIQATLGCVVKDWLDLATVHARLGELVEPHH